MSTPIKGFTVTIEAGIREEVAEKIAHALRMTVGVVDVRPVQENFGDVMVRMQVLSEIKTKLFESLT